MDLCLRLYAKWREHKRNSFITRITSPFDMKIIYACNWEIMTPKSDLFHVKLFPFTAAWRLLWHGMGETNANMQVCCKRTEFAISDSRDCCCCKLQNSKHALQSKIWSSDSGVVAIEILSYIVPRFVNVYWRLEGSSSSIFRVKQSKKGDFMQDIKMDILSGMKYEKKTVMKFGV